MIWTPGASSWSRWHAQYIVHQPETVVLTISDGSEHRYTPDFLIRFIDGTEVICEVKLEVFLLKTKDLHAAADALFGARNLHYVTVTDRQIDENHRSARAILLMRFAFSPEQVYGPSVGSVAAAMRNAILPKDDLLTVLAKPDVSWTAMGAAEMYVVDNGLEFHSKAFLRLAWHLHADLLFNPVRQPWLKASIERCMMEVCRYCPLVERYTHRGRTWCRKIRKPERPYCSTT